LLFDPDRTTAEAILEAARASRRGDWPAAAPPGREAAKTAFNTAVLGVAASGLAPRPIVSGLVAMTSLPVARRAATALRARRMSVDVLDLAAVGISLGTGAVGTAALLTWLLGIGDLLLEHAEGRARAAMSKLAGVEVKSAWVVRDGRVERVRAKKLRPGDRIRVHVGEQVAADGVVASGKAAVDEKALTGESMPRTKRLGARVLAASVVQAGEIDVDVTRVGRDTTAAKIVRILQGAGAKPMTLQREMESMADRVVLPTIALGVGAGAVAADLGRTTSVLITDFGSGIRIAAPTGALAAMTAAAREGVLVKGGQFLERLSKVDVIVFDKTGTLTEGSARIVDAVTTGSIGLPRVLALAAAAEERQSHPVARAVRIYAREARVGARGAREAELGSFTYDVGGGVSASVADHRVLVGAERFMRAQCVDTRGAAAIVERQKGSGTSPVFIAVDGRLEALLVYADVVRGETRDVLDLLRAGGRREIVLMSGDAGSTVDAVGRELKIAHRRSGMLPEDKAREIRAMQQAGRVVAMVGDGINDAPALAVADVGISITGSTDVALETADVVLVEGGLASLPRAFALADSGMASVRRGLALVIAPNAFAILLGALGVIGPGIATAVNNGSTVAAALASLSPLAGSRRGAHFGASKQ
jgi:Cu2+-exporting ATPase